MNDWKLNSPARRIFVAQDLPAGLPEPVQGHEDRIRTTAQALGLEVTMQVVAEWDATMTATPISGLTTVRMERRVSLEAGYDVDFYSLCS